MSDDHRDRELRHVHRDLDFGTKHLSHGPDVAEFRAGVSRSLRHLRLGFLLHFTAPSPTRHTIARCIFALGLSERARIAVLHRGYVGRWTQRKVRNPNLRGPIDRARAAARRPTLREWRRQHRASRVTVMFDSITLKEIPESAPAVAGYTGGNWPTYRELRGRFPKSKLLSIAIQSSEDADVLDIEPGNATPADAPGWVRRQLRVRREVAAGKAERNGLYNVDRPVLYASASQMAEVLRELDAADIPRELVLIWTAHYTFTPHICGPTTCGELAEEADGTQWTDHAMGRNLDQSLLRPGFFA